MNLKEATLNLKEYTTNEKTITPILANDWKIELFKGQSDRILLKSKKEDKEILLFMEVSDFFKEFIFNNKIKLIENNLIGSLAVGKYTVMTEEIFIESKRTVERNNMEAIPDHLLAENVIYTEKEGDSFIYMGERELFFIKPNTVEVRRKNKYILKTENLITIDKGTKFQIKSSQKKMIKIKKVLSVLEKDLFYINLANHLYNSDVFILGKENFKNIKEVTVEDNNNRSLIKYKGEYYLSYKKRRSFSSNLNNDKSYELFKIKIDDLKKDIQRGILHPIKSYFTDEKTLVELTEKEKQNFMILFLE